MSVTNIWTVDATMYDDSALALTRPMLSLMALAGLKPGPTVASPSKDRDLAR